MLRLVLSLVILCNPLFSKELKYLNGFGNEHCSEAKKGALPQGQNSPREVPFGLFAEQISGTSFTTPRAKNLRTWFYRTQPSVQHHPFTKIPSPNIQSSFTYAHVNPNQMRWTPFPLPSEKVELDFVDGLQSIAGAGDPSMKSGLAIYIYTCNQSMKDRCFYNADGDFLIVPQLGDLKIQSECGWLELSPGEICVIPRGIRFRVEVEKSGARGYISEVFDGHYQLPELGPIGANGLANPRDFLYPTAAYELKNTPYRVVAKFQGELFEALQDFSPFNVVAYHGNYLPFKYDLKNFQPMGALRVDHPDPSIFTVLTCPTAEVGVASLDFVVFPPRWLAAENTFRPPYFHRNTMSEFMGLIQGDYDAKAAGFLPGGASLHLCMTPHGPDKSTYEKAIQAEKEPEFVGEGSWAFMFETTYLLRLTDFGLRKESLDTAYMDVWQGFEFKNEELVR